MVPAQAGEPHMIENYIHYVFVFEFNHAGFIILQSPQVIEPGVLQFAAMVFQYLPCRMLS